MKKKNKESKLTQKKPWKLSVEETKLATERLIKEQIALAAENEKIISKLESFFLDFITSLEHESLPLEIFLDGIYLTEPTELQK